jgi:hypothetical protein
MWIVATSRKIVRFSNGIADGESNDLGLFEAK